MNKTRQTNLVKKSVTKSLVMLLAVLMTGPVLAQPWYHPKDGVDSASVQNTSNEPVTIWLTGPSQNGQFQEEQSIDIAPKESKVIDLKNSQGPYFTFKSYLDIPVKISLQKNNRVFALPSGRGDTLMLNVRPSFGGSSQDSATLTLSNLIPFGQDGRIRIFSFFNQERVVPFSLNAHETKNVSLQLFGAQKIQIEGGYALGAHLSYKNTEEAGTPVRSVASLSPKKEGSYFLMSNSDHTQSYVFHTTNEKLAQQARDQISGLSYKKVLVAKVQLGHGNMNRDLYSPLKTVWSWSVSEALNFADAVSQDCDGSPQIVEDFLSWWVSKPAPVICFWHYKVEKELSTEEITSP